MVAPGVDRTMRALRTSLRKQSDLRERGITESDRVLAQAMDLAMLDASMDTAGAELNIAATHEARAVA